jgi:hypothetical protein
MSPPPCCTELVSVNTESLCKRRPSACVDRYCARRSRIVLADAGIHALTASRAVDVTGVTQQEHTALTEAAGDAVMDMIGGKPVYLRDRKSGLPRDIRRTILKAERRLAAHTLGNQPDETDMPFLLHWEGGVEASPTHEDMQLAIGGRAGCGYIGDIEEILIAAAGEFHAKRAPDRAMRAVATA